MEPINNKYDYQDDLEAVLEHAVQNCKNVHDRGSVLDAISEAADYVVKEQGYGESMESRLANDAICRIDEYLDTDVKHGYL
jgi:hypothetical protein